jgi:hypothetical protein
MATTQIDEKAIMCTLTAADFRSRLAWIADLNRDALLGKRRSDLRLEMTYAPYAAARVREMVRREQECCAFLAFDVRKAPDAVHLTITAPAKARDAADLLFEQFQSVGLAGDSSCGCAASAPSPTRVDGNACQARTRGVGIAAPATSTGALACAVCCVLPFAVPAVMLTAAGGVIAWLAGAATWAAGLALVAIVAGWTWIGLQTASARARPPRSTLYAMGIATVILALAFGWPLYEAPLLRMMANA